MAIVGRTHRPIMNRDKCRQCGICIGACPAEVQPDFRNDLGTVRGFVYQKSSIQFQQAAPPCSHACPLGQDVRKYVELLSQGRLKEAVLAIREDNPLPGICAYACHHPCEQACVRANWDDPVSIRELKRSALQYETINQEEILSLLLSKKAASKEKKVAIVGAGPAGLACAFSLTMAGYQVRVLDALPKPGGMLIGAIPDFRLPRRVIDQDVNMIGSLGVNFTPSFQLGNDAILQELLSRGTDALVIATGAWKDLTLSIPGETGQGSLSCLEFLLDIQAGHQPSVSGRVLVIGGGNAAMDTARSALRLGAREVVVLYRRTRQEMPALPEEVEAAIHEGVKIEQLVVPKRFVVKEGKIAGLELVHARLGDCDESGRRRPVPLEGTDYCEPADMVITAIGQRPDLSFLQEQVFSPWGGIQCDSKGMLAGRSGVFAAGDAVSGPSTIVQAATSGKHAALRVMDYLEGVTKC